MATEFTTCFRPTPEHKQALQNYNRSVPPNQQHGVPQEFIDIMTIREKVFVEEQGVPLENEMDDEDAHCWHFLIYVSVGAPKGQSAEVQRGFNAPSDTNSVLQTPVSSEPAPRRVSASDVQKRRARATSTATRAPAGTIRLIPPKYRDPNSRRKGSEAARTSSVSSSGAVIPHPTTDEPYVKLGRLAVLKEFRGMNLSKLITNVALQAARQNAHVMQPRVDTVEEESLRISGVKPLKPWNGLVYVHAQKDRTLDLWRKWGFKIDEQMGEWDEEGMMHVGMWKQLDIEQQ
ncbi:hypothetical protein BT63DRAFT_114550 [Microthyrium microscopicum]|uniref:Uncharacterized protein n=1 Tax=Microthyrium microscopicum TaxID=703497 RepID=A0A6A6TVY7_9PEZI|nr:hypothetical protein BT63DRAFT_114550 [Microthyrium microscopicum]